MQKIGAVRFYHIYSCFLRWWFSCFRKLSSWEIFQPIQTSVSGIL